MNDIVYNAMINFQFFCNDVLKKINIDKLRPKQMGWAEWKTKKPELISADIESIQTYLDQQAAKRLESYPVDSKLDIEKRFTETIAQAISGYKEKLYNYYQ